MNKLAFTLKEAASLLGVHPNTVYKLARRGELLTIALGARKLVPRKELARLGFLAKEENPADGRG